MIRVFLMIVSALVLPLGAADYQGKVGSLNADFSLEWGDDGSVSGTYTYESRPGVIYGLEGANPAEGELYLEEYTGSKLTARCYLAKAVTDGAIIWRGEMRNVDGRVIPMEFARGRGQAAPAPAATAAETRYTGYVGRLDAEFSLYWNADRSVQGSYHHPAEPDTVYRIFGTNRREGELVLEEYTGRDLSARAVLQKRIEADTIVWEGMMMNLDGRRFPMAFSRARESSPAPALDDFEARRAVVLARLESEVHWEDFPLADALVEMVPIYLEDGHYFAGRVVEASSGGGESQMRFEVGDWDDDGHFHQDGQRELTLRMARELPLPAELLLGRDFALYADVEGKLFAVELVEIAITHVRRSASGKFEVRGLVDLVDDDGSGEWNAAAFAEKMKSAPRVEFVPDKVALEIEPLPEAEPDEDLFFQTIRLVRDYGISIQATAAGPGSLELESLSLDAAEEWIPLQGIRQPIKAPPSQLTRQAG